MNNPSYVNIPNGLDLNELGTQAETVHCAQNAESAGSNDLNPFPIEAFPKAIQKIIRDLKNILNYTTDFTGAGILYATSLALGNTHQVEVKGNWRENAVIFIALVGRPGTNKSHPVQTAIQPLLDRDKITYRQFELNNQEFKKDSALSKNERDKQGVRDPIKPVWKKFIVSDFTPEALAQVHQQNLRGIGVYCDELASWIKNFNRYNSGSEQETWLTLWSGKMLSIDRKTGDPVFIPKPFIPVIGTIQNSVLKEISKNGRGQNGFIDRILFAFPDYQKKEYWNDNELPPATLNNWHRILSNLMELKLHVDEYSNPVPKILSFNPNAKQVLSDWVKTNTDSCNAVDNETIAGIYSKLEIYAIRLSLILQMLRWACVEGEKEHVGVEAVEGALLLIEYFRKTAIKAHSIISNFSPLDKLPTDKRKLYEALPNSFSTNEGLNLALQSNFRERDFKRFLTEKELFTRSSYGQYEKIFK